MSSIQATVLLLAVISSLALAAAGIGRPPRGRLQWSFSLGMLGFAVESLASLVLLTRTEQPEEIQLWLAAVEAAGVLLMAPWAFFVATLAHPEGTGLPLRWRFGLGIGSALALGGAAAVVVMPAFDVSVIPAPFFAARLDLSGRVAVIVQILATVGILGGLEACLRTSKGTSRWRVKYLILGLGGIFLVRFYLLGQLLLFNVLMAVYLPTAAATLFVGNLVIGASLARNRLVASELTVSRQIVYRSAVVGVLGLYLFTVGLLGWLLTHFGIPEDIFWGSLVVFVSALGLATLLFSENVRWRLKRFIGVNFYRSKYDYRQQWSTFTKRLGSLLTLEELAPQLLGAVTEAVGTARGLLYLTDGRDGRYHLAGAVEVDRAPATLDAAAGPITRLREGQRPLFLDGGGDVTADETTQRYATLLGEGGVAVPLYWRGSLTGVMMVGAERTGEIYTPEDLEFLATVGEQAAGVIVTARLSEAVAQSREFEAFHRLTSFVIHDLKNSVTALSMLSQNALQHFDDPEFQRDAIKTVSRTVDRIKALLTRLSSAPEPAPLRLQPIDLSALVQDAVRPIAGGARVRLETELASLPPVAGDPEAILRVIQNLVTNAVEALDGEGLVRVKTSEQGGWAVIAVSDTGCGMSEDFLRKSLFAPFRSTKKGGWGIGLYQARGIVEGHGGSIEVASKEGEGTTFWIRLPIERPAPGETRS
jgi:putative PEP-CTERM system histidine kinase